MSRPTTLGDLRASGWESRPVKEEVRANAIARVAAGETPVSGVLGFEDTVIPQLENALLAGHDVIFLGERGQAKTRMIRSLTALLDEWMPIVAGSEINDDPYHPVSHYARVLVAERGDDTPIDWIHRDRRFGEKLATPDTSIADLIGEVDPIKVAEGRYLSDELTIHYGLVPRTNRGIFAINELPDLAERIQVGLLNVLEERDVQIRGYKIRLPLDVMLVASANPEDYTNRGRIITPLKDRFGSQIRTHYPLDVETEMQVIDAGDASARLRRPRRHRARVHDRDRRGDQPAGSAVTARQPAVRSVGPAVDRELRDAGGERDAPRAAQRRARGRAAGERPRGAGRVDRRQDRDRDHRRRPRGPGARAHRQGQRARGVPLPGPPGEARGAGARLRRRSGHSHRRRRPELGVRRSSSARRRACATRSATSGSARPRPGSPRPSSSSSRACTSRSGSTRTPSAPAPPTAPAGKAALGRPAVAVERSAEEIFGKPLSAVRRSRSNVRPREIFGKPAATSPCACTSRSPDRRGGSRCRPRSRCGGCRPPTCRRPDAASVRRGTCGRHARCRRERASTMLDTSSICSASFASWTRLSYFAAAWQNALDGRGRSEAASSELLQAVEPGAREERDGGESERAAHDPIVSRPRGPSRVGRHGVR